MTKLSLETIVAQALAKIGVVGSYQLPTGYPRTITWIAHERAFGIRQSATGREVYIAQTRMGGRVRTVTIAPASVISHHQALTVARRVLAYASVGYDPAADRQRIRSAPLFDDFPNEFWRRWSPQWKASTQEPTPSTATTISTVLSPACSSTS